MKILLFTALVGNFGKNGEKCLSIRINKQVANFYKEKKVMLPNLLPGAYLGGALGHALLTLIFSEK